MVLVVDDEPAIRLLCTVNLGLAGYEVREAGSVDQARAALADGEVAAVFLDVHLGSERTEALLEELRAAGIPVAVVTGSTDLSVYQGSADAVLSKPFSIADLEAIAAGLTGRTR